jgi:hypothetical protein
MSKVGVDLYCQQNHPTVDKFTKEEETEGRHQCSKPINQCSVTSIKSAQVFLIY